MGDIFIQSKVIDIFPKFKMAARPLPSWIFSLCEFGHSGVLAVWYLCSVPHLVQISVIITEIDAHASDLYLMTSRKLTSGFDFWSCGHLCMAVMHLAMKFGADMLIQFGVIDIFRKLWWLPPSWICLGEPWDHPQSHIHGAYLL